MSGIPDPRAPTEPWERQTLHGWESYHRAIDLLERDEWPSALRLLAVAETEFRTESDQAGLWRALSGQAAAHWGAGDAPLAIARATAALLAAEADADREGFGLIAWQLAVMLLAQGDYQRAGELLLRAEQALGEAGAPPFAAEIGAAARLCVEILRWHSMLTQGVVERRTATEVMQAIQRDLSARLAHAASALRTTGTLPGERPWSTHALMLPLMTLPAQQRQARGSWLSRLWRSLTESGPPPLLPPLAAPAPLPTITPRLASPEAPPPARASAMPSALACPALDATPPAPAAEQAPPASPAPPELEAPAAPLAQQALPDAPPVNTAPEADPDPPLAEAAPPAAPVTPEPHETGASSAGGGRAQGLSPAEAQGAPARPLTPPSGARIAVTCFGPFRVTIDDRPVERWESVRARTIFKYLVVRSPAPVSKELLAELFWPDSDPDLARRSLHQAIYCLRQSLKRVAPDLAVIRYADDCYQLSPDATLWVDSEAFTRLVGEARAAVAAGDQEAAMAAYATAADLMRGTFLEEERYEAWAEELRHSYSTMYSEALHRLSRHYIARGEHATAVLHAQRILNQEPCDEEAHLFLMRSYVAQGLRHLAVRQYQICANALRSELGLTPSPEIERFYRQVLASE